jgi:hypothetical protein
MHNEQCDLNNLLDGSDADYAKVIKALERLRRTSLAQAGAAAELTRALQHRRADRKTAPPAINQAAQESG